MAVNRHRRNHVVAPAKRREVAEQRAQVLAAAEAGDPSPWLTFLLTCGRSTSAWNALRTLPSRTTSASLSHLSQCSRSARSRSAPRSVVWMATLLRRLGREEFVVDYFFSGGRTQQLRLTPSAPEGMPDAGKVIRLPPRKVIGRAAGSCR
jgi:hypothetical protein